MKLILFGATGMVGMGTLREALADPSVEGVLSVGRSSCGVTHPKLQELLLPDLFDFAAPSNQAQLQGYDACLWCLGISSVGMDEAAYAKITEQLTLLWARELLRLNPTFSFCYCCGAGADGSAMWARVRRRVETGLQALPFKHVGVVRPGMIEPGRGITHRVKAYKAFIFVLRPIFPLLVRGMPGFCTTSERLGRAMLRVVQGKADRYILESVDINQLGAAA